MKTSQIAAKIVLRLFLFLILACAIPFVTGDNAQLQHMNFVVYQKWMLIFPGILIVGFITLFIICTVNKYKKADLNWVLVVNTVVLIVYLLAIALKTYQLLK